MSKFTDDELERLKFSLGTLYVPTINPKILDTLIARLEAAERLAGAACSIAMANNLFDDLIIDHEAWRKAAGK